MYTNEKDSNGNAYYDELEITVLGAATLPTCLEGNSYANDAAHLYCSFDADTKKLSVTYINGSSPIMDTLTLTNEVNGTYTFTSSNSTVMIENIAEDGSSFEVVSNSSVKGVSLPSGTLIKVS